MINTKKLPVEALILAQRLLRYQTLDALDITHLKLQKLLYYVQAYHLAFLDVPIFDEDIEAWSYGPVVPSVYEAYKAMGSAIIEYPANDIQFSTNTEEVISAVLSNYGHLSAMTLVHRTHSEYPWRNAYERGALANGIIAKDVMQHYYKQFINVKARA